MFNVFSITDLPLQVKVRSTATEAKVMQKPATSTSNSGQQMGATECMGMLEQLLAKWCPNQPTYSIPGPKSQKVSSWRCQCLWHLCLCHAQQVTKARFHHWSNQLHQWQHKKSQPWKLMKMKLLKHWPGRPPRPAKALPKAVTKDKYDCPRCRGNRKGCDVCIQPKYTGLILNGHAVWKAQHQNNHKS